MGREKLTINIRLYRLMRQHLASINIHLIAHRHIISQHRHILQARPLAHCRVPSHNRGLDPGMILDLATLENHTPLQPNTISDHDTRTDGYIRAYTAILAHLGGRVDEHVAAVYPRLARGEELGRLAREGAEVEASAGKEILWLTDIHPEAVKVEAVQLTVGTDGGEDLGLDGCGSELNALEDGGVEDVDSRIDPVSDEFHGLFHEAVDPGWVAWLVDDDSVLAGLFDLGDNYGALLAVRLVEIREGLEGVVADDIGVKHKEGRIILAENSFSELEGSGGAEGFRLERECNLDVVLLLVLRRGELGGGQNRRGGIPS